MCTDSQYKLRGLPLKPVKEVRDLGFIVSADLSFDSHYRSIVKKANYRIYNLFKVLRTRDPQIYLRAYKTYVRPIVENGVTVFNPVKRKDIDFLEGVQNSFTRKLVMRCFGLKYAQVPCGAERSKLLGLSSLSNRRRKADLLMMFKILSGKLSIRPIDFFGAPLTRTVRGKLGLRVPMARSRVRANFLTYRSIKELNSLLNNDELLCYSVASWVTLFKFLRPYYLVAT